jgi:hypothetical protein
MVSKIGSEKTAYSTSIWNPAPEVQAVGLAIGDFAIIWPQIGAPQQTNSGTVIQPNGIPVPNNQIIINSIDTSAALAGTTNGSVAIADTDPLSNSSGIELTVVPQPNYAGTTSGFVIPPNFSTPHQYAGVGITSEDSSTAGHPDPNGFAVSYYDTTASGTAVEVSIVDGNAWAQGLISVTTLNVASGANLLTSLPTEVFQSASSKDLLVEYDTSTGIGLTLETTAGSIVKAETVAGVTEPISIAPTENGNFGFALESNGQILFGILNGSNLNSVLLSHVISPASETSDVAPELAALSNGDYVAAWYNSSAHQIDGQLLDANGQNIGSEFQVNTNTASVTAHLSVAALTNGNFAIAWADDNGQTSQVEYQTFSPGGHVADNFGGDGVSDILFHNDSGVTAIYDMHADGSSNAIQLGTIDPTWKIEDTPNFGNGSDDDILWQNASSGQIVYWSVTAGHVAPGYTDLGTLGPQWQIESHDGSSDFTGDDADDILFRDTSSNLMVYWNMQGGKAVNTVVLGTAPNSQWSVAGTGDFNGDGKSDILWHNDASGDAFIWASGGTGPTIDLGTINTAWQVAGTGDFKGDGVDDILWFNTQTHQAVYWDNHADGTSTTVDLGITPNGFTFDKPRDLTGDGTADFLLHNSSNGMIVSAANDGGHTGAFHVIDTLPTSWHII